MIEASLRDEASPGPSPIPSLDVYRCNGCGRDLPSSEFAWKRIDDGTQHARCRSCQHDYYVNVWYPAHASQRVLDVAARKREQKVILRQLVTDYMSTTSCEECGGVEKLMATGSDVRRLSQNGVSVERMVEELMGSTILCRSCGGKHSGAQAKPRKVLQEA